MKVEEITMAARKTKNQATTENITLLNMEEFHTLVITDGQRPPLQAFAIYNA